MIKLKYKLYADDTVLYSKQSNESNIILKNNIQKDLDNVRTWCKGNAIIMSVKKRSTMMFGMRQKVCQSMPLKIYVYGRRLDKYLGTFLDSKLTFMIESNETIKFPKSFIFQVKINVFSIQTLDINLT